MPNARPTGARTPAPAPAFQLAHVVHNGQPYTVAVLAIASTWSAWWCVGHVVASTSDVRWSTIASDLPDQAAAVEAAWWWCAQ